MKVLLWSSYGKSIPIGILKKVTNRVDYCSLSFRTDTDILCDLISLASERSKGDNIERLKIQKGLLYIEYTDTDVLDFLWYDDALEDITSFSIVDVDTTRPWTIDEYDGAEYIKYLDTYTLENESLNFYRLKDES